MKILLIGHSVKDYIHTDNSEIISPGGIYYSLIGMTNFLDKNDEVFLVTSMDKNNEYMFRDRFQYINKDFVQYSGSIPVVHLYQAGTAERCERYENITSKLDLSSIKEYNSFDGIMINMITGFDISAADLINIRSNYSGLIYIDIHTLARGLGDDGSREFRLIPDADQWINNVNIIQANESELKTLAPGSDDDERINYILSGGVKILLITRGEKGAEVFLNKGAIERHAIHAIEIDSKNKIGCGDIFGSVFFYNYLKDRDLLKALRIANTAAGVSTGYSKIDDFKKLKDDTFSRFN